MMANATETVEYTLSARSGVGQYTTILLLDIENSQWYLVKRCWSGDEVSRTAVENEVARTLLSARQAPEFVRQGGQI